MLQELLRHASRGNPAVFLEFGMAIAVGLAAGEEGKSYYEKEASHLAAA